MILAFLIFGAHARDAIELDLMQYGQAGSAPPKLTHSINNDLDSLEISLKCGGNSFRHGPQPAKRGDKIEISLELPPGKYRCRGTTKAAFSDGGQGEMPLDFQVEMFEPLVIQVDRDKSEIDQMELIASMDRPVRGYSVEVLSASGDMVGQGAAAIPEQSNLGPQKVGWTQISDDVAVIRVRGEDIYGFWAQIDLLPWHYEIPHEDVIFASSSHQIEEQEEPKLDSAKREVDTVFQKYAHIAEANLYVAGYTDTVGPAASNQQLSEARARAIAQWFQDQSFQGQIYYQGFGEEVLAVPTPDSTDEARNRRVLYIVAAEAPPSSPDLPRKNWKRLK